MAERLYKYVDNELLDKFQIIQSRVRDLDPTKKKIYWVHDLAQDPEVQHLRDGGWEKFDKIVFVSHWQQQMYNLILGVPYSAGTVIRNAIDPIEPHEKPNDGKVRLIYTSTPHRGLDILYAAFEVLAKQYDDVELDVYSSFGLYGWPQRDEPFQELFSKLEEHPQINYHKSVPNDQIRNALKRANIFAYPSTWQETSCLCLIEAMSAGLECVHSSLAALPETSLGLTRMYGFTEDRNAHANNFYMNLVHAVEVQKKVKPNYDVQKAVSNHAYGWESRKYEWEGLLSKVLTN